MKKVLSLFIIVVLVLAGCNKVEESEAVIKFKEKVAFLSEVEYYDIELTTDEEVYEDYSTTYSTKVDGSISKVDFMGLEVYIDEEFMYTNFFTWLKSPITEEDKGNLEEQKEILNSVNELVNISGDKKLDSIDFADLKTKKVNEYLVETSDNVFSFKGYEDKVTIDFTTDEEIKISVLDDEKDSNTIMIIKEGKEIVIPKEALEAEEFNPEDLDVSDLDLGDLESLDSE